MINLGLSNPAGYPKQHQFISMDREVRNDDDELMIHHSNFVGGRGCSKSTTGIILLLNTVLDMPGMSGYWSEPRWPDIEKVFMRHLRNAIPEDSGAWKYFNKSGYRFIRWANGHITDLVSRNVDNPNKRVGLGPNYAYGIDDELQDKFDLAKAIDMQNAIRLPGAPYLYHASLATPTMGGFFDWCHQPGAINIHATSYENPYISDGAVDSMVAAMDADTAKQEIYGQWVPLSGRIWKNFEEKPWPDGNIIEGMEFDHDRPYHMSIDLGGAQSSIQIVQYIDPIHERKMMFKGKLPVVVAEYVPNRELLEDVVNLIEQRYQKPPIKVIVGSDVSSPGTTGHTAGPIFGQRGWEYGSPTGRNTSKEVQRQVASSLMLNTLGERRFAVACNKDQHGRYQIIERHYGENKQRGIMHMLRTDTFPEDNSDGTFVKDKNKNGLSALEDCRDAMLYWMIYNHAPTWTQTKRRAA